MSPSRAGVSVDPALWDLLSCYCNYFACKETALERLYNLFKVKQEKAAPELQVGPYLCRA